MTIRRTYLLVLAVSACGVDVPAEPTWTEHVRPILAANCIRCHGATPIGGAPTSFRLDTYEDTDRLDESPVRGAATMARFIAVRAGEMGEMPPDWPRTDDQRDILINWWARADEAGAGVMPELGPFRASDPPTAVALDLPASADADPVTVRYEIADPDGDLVTGALLVGGVVVSRDLIDGRGSVTFDPASFPEGSHDVIARVSDDIDEVDVTLGTIDVAHASGNTAPRVRIAASADGVVPMRDVMITRAVDPVFSVFILVEDPDAGDSHTLDLIAVRGADERVVQQGIDVTAGIRTQFDWDVAAPMIPDGTNWRLRAVVTDGVATTTAETAPFIVSHASTDLTHDSVEDILDQRCVLACHPNPDIPEVPQSFFGRDAVKGAAGLIYRRAIEQRTMPPPSATGILDGYEPMTAAERATLGEYLLGGSPP